MVQNLGNHQNKTPTIKIIKLSLRPAYYNGRHDEASKEGNNSPDAATTNRRMNPWFCNGNSGGPKPEGNSNKTTAQQLSNDKTTTTGLQQQTNIIMHAAHSSKQGVVPHTVKLLARITIAHTTPMVFQSNSMRIQTGSIKQPP